MKLDLKYRLSLGALHLVALLPLCVLYIFSDIAYFITYHIVGYRRKIVRANLNLAFGADRAAEIPKIEKQFYRHLCDLFVEAIKVLHISEKKMRKRFVVTNPEIINAASRDNRSQIFMLGHYCNWEWCPAMKLYLETKDDVTAQVYKPLHNKTIDRLALRLRTRYGMENIPQQKTIRRLFGVHDEGRNYIVGLISDQRPTGRDFHHWTKFLGLDTPYVVGGEKIGIKSNALFYYTDVTKIKRGYYTLTFVPLQPPAQGEPADGHYAKQFMAKLEESIIAAPQYWLWSHKIWKRDINGRINSNYRFK